MCLVVKQTLRPGYWLHPLSHTSGPLDLLVLPRQQCLACEMVCVSVCV